MRAVLPFEEPLAYAYQFYAFPLGILATHPKASDWVLSNYVQVVYEYTGQSAPVPFAFYVYDYSVSPWLETLRLNREWWSMSGMDITRTVREAIGSGFYVYLTLNERHVPGRWAHGGERDFRHDVLIRGFDDEQGTFELYGYDDRYKFRGTRLPQADLARAYHDTGPGAFYDVPFTLYRYHDAGEYTFDLGYVARGVREYLDSFNTSTHFQAQRDPWDRAYGVATYDLLESYLDGYARGEERYDIRNVQVLWEHKRVMVARFRRCAEPVPEVDDLIAPYEAVERMAWMLRMRMIAHRAGSYPTDFRADALSLVDRIRSAERPLLENFARLLEEAPVSAVGQDAPTSST
ncbi:hypothetical protein [Actinophytocola glycyrrhizae]|uniref:Uncharacterized protein n=1 Tax=Actinophytocola glycyrrhizae TaxID=2044873 RepID=A0ABV9S369_9PSEU